MQPFRFGLQLRGGPVDDIVAQARAAEVAGFNVVHTFDHVGDLWPPLTPLAAIAAATSLVRLCPLVLNNDFHHPVHLAREVAALDHLSGGRVELGIGAGHSFPEYAAIGATFDPPPTRKARLAEAVEVLRQLLDGETVTYTGDHYQLDGVRTMRSRQDRLPILVGVNGERALRHAALHADTIGLTMLGRTLPDGDRHEVRWRPERLDAVVETIRSASGDRGMPELNALVQVVEITDDRGAAAARLADGVEGLTVDDALATPFLALGTHDEIARQFIDARERWGISYYSVRDGEAFAPVIARLGAG